MGAEDRVESAEFFGFEVNLAEMRTWSAEGVDDNEILRRLHDAGVNIAASLGAFAMAFDIPLDQARTIVSGAPVWAYRREADDETQRCFDETMGRIADIEVEE